jgi:RHS repeat-associated protein
VFPTNGSGTVVWTLKYLPFGGVESSTGTPIAARFPGQWFQSESALHQNWMRDYDPTTGRYLQADPLGLVDGASVYGYAWQSPLRYVDPMGLQDTNDLGYFDRFFACVAENDPLSELWKKGALAAAGAPFPKSAFGLPRGLGSASPMTTLPSVAAHKIYGEARMSRIGSAMRDSGRLGYWAFLGYGLFMLGVEGACACEAMVQ